jgi:hypothetical protein
MAIDAKWKSQLPRVQDEIRDASGFSLDELFAPRLVAAE